MTSLFSWNRVTQGLFHHKPWIRLLTILLICLAVGLPLGALMGLVGALYGTALLAALLIAYLVLRLPLFGILVLIANICLLPFAAIPINIGFSPTFLDLVLAALFFVWLNRLATHQERDFLVTQPTLPVILFVGLAIASFIIGLNHSRLTANVIRHFGEIVLSVSLFFLVINTVRSQKQLKWVVTVIILAGFAAALVGIVLYYLPDNITMRLLSALRIVRYPTGQSVLRYVEDNPDLALRATATSVDPNVLGGMLIFVTLITVTQALAKKPILPRPVVVPMLGTMFICLILTFSRGALVGLIAGGFLLGILRYPKILLIGLIVLALVFVLPFTQFYVEHFIEGIQGADLATQMRFGEYKDALKLISRYPWLGVGFSGTPEIDTYLGVSNVYLLIAEEMGIVGLTAFLIVLLVYFARFGRARSVCARDSELEPLLLGTSLSIAGAMVAGIVDHYFFNLDFPHAAALFWLILGLGTVAVRLVLDRNEPWESRQVGHRTTVYEPAPK